MDALIKEVNKLDCELYKARYIEKDYTKREKIWNSIKDNRKLLEVAIRVVRNKCGDRDTFLATSIVECMLIDYESVDKQLYQSLVNKIYTNIELARIVLDGYSNGGYSFLLYTLINNGLDLTDEQKTFAIEEAMNKIGTTKYSKQMSDYEQKLDSKGITDDLTVIAPEVGPIGAKTYKTYVANMFANMNTNQAHGIGEFDIRYYILKNYNFADKMGKLVYDFFADNENYDETVEYWESYIVNLCHGKDNDEDEPRIYSDEIMFISQEEVFKRLPLEQATKIMDEINFIKRLRKIRPVQWELKDATVKRNESNDKIDKLKLEELKSIFGAIDEASVCNSSEFPYIEMQRTFNQKLKEYLKCRFSNDIQFDREETFAYIQAHFKGVEIEINVHGGIILSIEDSEATNLLKELEPIFTEIIGVKQMCQYNYCSNAEGIKTSYPTAEWHKRPNERLSELVQGWNCAPLEYTKNFEDYYTQSIIEGLGDNIFTVDGYTKIFEGVSHNSDLQRYKIKQIQKQAPDVSLSSIYDWIDSSKRKLSLIKK